tara:strand:- start:1196 stop:2092 length:897 start_codon:yes stop_codon:yes gene_type:complete
VREEIQILDYLEHTKASERYVLAEFTYGKEKCEYLIPYYYRRTSMFLDSDEQITEYLEKIYDHLNPKVREKWEEKQEIFWSTKKKAAITREVFDKLLGAELKCNACKLPKNPNLQRRIQDIKEFGYTLSTKQIFCSNCFKKTTHHQLIYLPRYGVGQNEYETISPALKNKIINLLENYDTYENNFHSKSLLPDHKFPEIRWDKDTKKDNNNLSDQELKEKFQLMTNQRNLQKREVCRKCFQSNERGIIYGINYFYHGKKIWDKKIPKTGDAAEKGCIGCGWYDISKWRKNLQLFLTKT